MVEKKWKRWGVMASGEVRPFEQSSLNELTQVAQSECSASELYLHAKLQLQNKNLDGLLPVECACLRPFDFIVYVYSGTMQSGMTQFGDVHTKIVQCCTHFCRLANEYPHFIRLLSFPVHSTPRELQFFVSPQLRPRYHSTSFASRSSPSSPTNGAPIVVLVSPDVVVPYNILCFKTTPCEAPTEDLLHFYSPIIHNPSYHDVFKPRFKLCIQCWAAKQLHVMPKLVTFPFNLH